MQGNPHKLTVIDGETLMDKRLPPTKFCVDTLLPQGLCILGGSPKVGKSWLVLDLCVHVAQGTPLWGLDVARGEVLYLCLEDSERRIQERLNTITDNVPDGMYFATGCTSIESGVCDWLRDFKRQHPAISLIAIDTFQLIRTPTPDVSYGGDYAELRVLKELADELGICLLLVHHLRKMNDKDPVNKLSGSTGISGAADAIFVLDKNERMERFAMLHVSGRDIRLEEVSSFVLPLGATINMDGAAVVITVMTLTAAQTLGVSVSFVSAIVLSILATLGACGTSGVAGGSLLLIPMACSMFGINNDIAMQVVAVGFIISVIQDSCETAINSSGDVLFTATAEFREWIKNGRKLPL